MNDNLIQEVCNVDVVDCFFCTKKGKETLKEHGGELTLRQRQLLFMLSKNDKISRIACQNLLEKVSIKDLIEQELIKQESPCDSLCKKLNVEQECRNYPGDLNLISDHEIFGLLDMIENTRLKTVNIEYDDNHPSITPAMELIAKMSA